MEHKCEMRLGKTREECVQVLGFGERDRKGYQIFLDKFYLSLYCSVVCSLITLYLNMTLNVRAFF